MRTLIPAILIFTLAPVVHAADFHVAPNGNDANPGTAEKPFATLEKARDARRGQGGGTVWLDAGTYSQDKMFLLGPEDSGTPDAPVVYRAKEGADVRISGGRTIPVSAFVPVAGEAKERLGEKAQAQVMQADLKKLGITDYGALRQYGHALSVIEAPMELVFNDKIMTLARYPNTGKILIGKVLDKGSVPRDKDYTNIRGATFNYTDPRHANWVKCKDIWFRGTFNNGYADDLIPVAAIDPEKKTVKLASPHMYGVASGTAFRAYVALNILEELDIPGEYYIDRDHGMLYFWPPAGLANAKVSVSMLEDPVISLENASHVTFRGLTVENGRGIGIYIEDGHHNLIAGCTVRNLGTSGIFMGQGARQTFPHITHDDYDGVPVSRRIGNLQGHIYKYTTWDRKAGHDHTIQSCDVHDTGCGGIYLSGGLKKGLVRGNNQAINCKVHDYNRRNQFLWSGINIDGCGNRIAHCEIYNADFQGIYVHGNDHLYEYNEIHHVSLNSDDTSPWYVGRDPSDQGHLIRYNYFHDCGNPQRMTMGIYCDDGSCGVTAFGNVFYNMKVGHGMLYTNAGSDLKFQNNIVIDSTGPVVWNCSFLYTWGIRCRPFFHENGTYWNRLHAVDYKNPPYSVRYPNLTTHLDPIPGTKDEFVGMRPARDLMSDNVIVRGGKQLVHLSGKHAMFEQRDNFQTQDDPGFVDAAKQNFKLKDDSIVFKQLPNFKPIPFEKIGLYKDEYRKGE